MSAPAVHPRPHRRLSRAFAYGSFAVMVGGWVVFFVALVASPRALDDAWTTVAELPLVAELAIWLLGFPFLLGLAIWHASWDEALRLAAVAVLAGAYSFMFLPRKRSG